jgi:hypothetical protein
LLVFLEHVLGVTANLDVVGTIGVERPIDVLLRLAAAAGSATISVAAPLPFHPLEVSHRVLTVCALIVRPNPGFRGACCAIQENETDVGRRFSKSQAETLSIPSPAHEHPCIRTSRRGSRLALQTLWAEMLDDLSGDVS